MSNHPNWRLPEVPTFTLESPDFAEGEKLPDWARADGGNRIPTLRWSGAPEGTKSFAVTLFDPDAPTVSGFWHWAVIDIPANVTSLPADAGSEDGSKLPAGAVAMPNDAHLKRFIGAAPPKGAGKHRYYFAVHALDVPTLDLPKDASGAVLGFTLSQHTLARAILVAFSET